jgi:hypothetical protein
MPIQLNDKLFSDLQSSADDQGMVSAQVSGKLNPDDKTLDIEMVNDVPVEYAGEQDENAPLEEENAPEPKEGMPMEENKAKGKGGFPMVMMAFKSAAGKK